jgi:carbon-monoxide dehydrogenase medium subunit
LSLEFSPQHFFKPASLDEATRILKEYGPRARVIAGGTGIYEIAHRGLLSDVEALVDLSGLSLSFIRETQACVSIGACTTMSTMLRSPILTNNVRLAALSDALKAIQPLQVKNVATIGGAICTALPFFDLPVALLALDSIVVSHPSDAETALRDFVRGMFDIALAPHEFLVEIRLPINVEKKFGSAFLKFGITADDWALINCGVSVALEAKGKIHTARIVVGGGVGEKPFIASKTESALEGADPTDEEALRRSIENALEAELETTGDIRASAEYRMSLAKVLVRRGVARAANRALSGSVGLTK